MKVNNDFCILLTRSLTLACTIHDSASHNDSVWGNSIMYIHVCTCMFALHITCTESPASGHRHTVTSGPQYLTIVHSQSYYSNTHMYTYNVHVYCTCLQCTCMYMCTCTCIHMYVMALFPGPSLKGHT
jgi:hypothetical protein